MYFWLSNSSLEILSEGIEALLIAEDQAEPCSAVGTIGHKSDRGRGSRNLGGFDRVIAAVFVRSYLYVVEALSGATLLQLKPNKK